MTKIRVTINIKLFIAEPVLVVMEFAPHGNLRDFLRRRRPNQGSTTSSSTNTPTHSCPPNSNSNFSNNTLLRSYVNNDDFHLDVTSLTSSLSSSSRDMIQLTYKDLLSFSRQVAKGAEFLSSKQVFDNKQIEEETKKSK